jgi:hypothetical protein
MPQSAAGVCHQHAPAGSWLLHKVDWGQLWWPNRHARLPERPRHSHYAGPAPHRGSRLVRVVTVGHCASPSCPRRLLAEPRQDQHRDVQREGPINKLNPSRAHRRASSRPMPVDAPVTIAIVQSCYFLQLIGFRSPPLMNARAQRSYFYLPSVLASLIGQRSPFRFRTRDLSFIDGAR